MEGPASAFVAAAAAALVRFRGGSLVPAVAFAAASSAALARVTRLVGRVALRVVGRLAPERIFFSLAHQVSPGATIFSNQGERLLTALIQSG